MLPNLTSDVLGGGSSMYGMLLGLFGAGAMVGAVTRTLASRRLGPSLLRVCILAFGLAGLVVGVSSLVLLAVIITIAGVIWTWILATLNSTYQLLTPDWLRGRTMGAFILSVFGFVPLGAVASGAVGASVGADKALMIFSLAVVAIGGLSFRMPIPVLEQIEPPVVQAPHRGAIPGVEDSDELVLVITTWTVDPAELDTFLQVLSDLRHTSAFELGPTSGPPTATRPTCCRSARCSCCPRGNSERSRSDDWIPPR